MNERIAQRLAELRRAKGYSQEALARELGLSRQAVSKWERVESSPEMENLIALARLYGVSLDDLLRLEDDARDDVEDEHTGRVREQEAETSWQIEKDRAMAKASSAAVEVRAADREAATRSTEAAARASDAAANAARADAQVNDGLASSKDHTRRVAGPWSSFPYGWLTVLLFFVFGYLSRWSTAWLIFLAIPLYRWVAGILDEEYFRRQSARDVSSDDVARSAERDDATYNTEHTDVAPDGLEATPQNEERECRV